MKEKWVNISDKIMEYCIYGITFFIPISIAIVEILVSLGILSFLVKKILTRDTEFLKLRSTILVLLFFLFNIASFINSGPHLMKSVNALFSKWLEYILIYLIVQETLITGKRIKIALFIFLVSSVLVTADGISQLLWKTEFLRNRPMSALNYGSLSAITASFHHHNDFGAYLVVALSGIIALWMSKGVKLIYQLPIFGFLTMMVTCLLFTFSRGSWISFLFVLFLVILLSSKWIKPAAMLVVFMITIFLIPELRDRSLVIFEIGGDSDRIALWKTALKMIRDNPFLGKGLGTFMSNFWSYNPHLYIQYAHNCYLQMWAEIGVFGLLSFLSFLGFLLFNAVKKFKETDNFILLGLTAAVSGFLVHSFSDTGLYSLQLAVLFWVLIGMIAAILNEKCSG